MHLGMPKLRTSFVGTSKGKVMRERDKYNKYKIITVSGAFLVIG